MDTMKAILDRRSVRKYTGQPVSREKLLTLVKAGMAAPSSRDTRHFRFIIIDEPELVDRLAEGLPYARMLKTARHAIVVASDLSVAYGGMETGYWIQDCAAAAENILIASKAAGLGACWTGVHPREERVILLKEVLNLPEQVRPLCLITVGVSAGEDDKPRVKFDECHVYWNTWS
ncbi:MAG: nitroreductase family protein [Candidatus Omnitrophota bacterium]